jgi:hypothetical protein
MYIFQFLEMPKQKLKIMIIGKDNKLNSSKSTMQTSEHPFLKKIYMQKYSNCRFRSNGKVGKHIVCANILHYFVWFYEDPLLKIIKLSHHQQLSLNDTSHL